MQSSLFQLYAWRGHCLRPSHLAFCVSVGVPLLCCRPPCPIIASHPSLVPVLSSRPSVPLLSFCSVIVPLPALPSSRCSVIVPVLCHRPLAASLRLCCDIVHCCVIVSLIRQCALCSVICCIIFHVIRHRRLIYLSIYIIIVHLLSHLPPCRTHISFPLSLSVV